jgi:hypothetical protein
MSALAIEYVGHDTRCEFHLPKLSLKQFASPTKQTLWEMNAI